MRDTIVTLTPLGRIILALLLVLLALVLGRAAHRLMAHLPTGATYAVEKGDEI
jgi:hypothetical protein